MNTIWKMCGIGGAVSLDCDFKGVLPLILHDQRFRGPDHAATLDFHKDHLQISLAHNRLAILDLNADANQPFVDAASGACIVFNGEIYNYIELRHELKSYGERFRTTSDTEVLLKAYLRWGTGAFERFNGMFAFAIWDPRQQRLVLARDRFGVKPCYFVQRDGRFAFASNTTALAKYLDLKIDRAYLGHGVLSGLFEDGNKTSPFVDMQTLPAGHFLVLNGGPLRIEPFYDIRARIDRHSEELKGLSDLEIESRLDGTIRAAVDLRLRSDVPVTLSLSGGLDSALLGAYMREIKPDPLAAFTFGAVEDRESEAGLARLSAERMGIQLNYARIEKHQVIECFERTLDAQGAPFAHPSVIAQNRIFQMMHDHGYKVAIGGQGADEVFLGYRKFQFFNLSELFAQRNWSAFARDAFGLALMLREEITHFGPVAGYVRRYLSKPRSREIFLGQRVSGFDLGFGESHSMRERQIADIAFASLLTLLRYEDRNSMGASIESRLPFLDYNVVEMGLALRSSLKIRRGYGKWILRRLAADRLPREIVNARRKRAFSLSVRDWLGPAGLGEYLYQSIRANMGRLRETLGPDYLAIIENRAAFQDPSNFALMVLAHWIVTRV